MSQTMASPLDRPTTHDRRDIIAWWEKRRLFYNVCVGLVGISSIIVALLAGSQAVQPGEDFVEPLMLVFGPLMVGILANACYTLGWIVDIAMFRGKPRVTLFRLGLILSMLLTAGPGLWAVTAWIYTLATGNKLGE